MLRTVEPFDVDMRLRRSILKLKKKVSYIAALRIATGFSNKFHTVVFIVINIYVKARIEGVAYRHF